MSEQSPEPERLDPLPQGRRIGQRKPLTPGDMTLRNVVWALALTVAVVVIAAMAVLGVGREKEPTVPETSRLDVAASAARAQEQADFPVAVPELGEDWEAREARLGSGEDATWQVRYTSPSGDLVTLLEGRELSASQISQTLPGYTTGGDETVTGAPCQRVLVPSSADGANGADGSEEQQHGYACSGTADGQDWSLLVYGAAPQDELRSLTETAISSLPG